MGEVGQDEQKLDLATGDGDPTVLTPHAEPSLTDARALIRLAGGEALASDGEISGYVLGGVLGEGGFGTVYRADQIGELDREVAIKLIKPGMASPEIVRRFEAERQALALMDHPNIARVYEAGTTADGRPFFAMELVEGMPLVDYCDRHQLDLGDRISIFCEVLTGIAHAHHKAILHRDLKPNNILVVEIDGKPVPKIIDFGIAKALGDPLGDQTLMTAPGVAMGTPSYMSPEQFGTIQGGVDTRSDIYALGVVLYELVTGSTPLGRNALQELGMVGLDKALRDGAETAGRRLAKLAKSELSETLATERSTSLRQLRREVDGDLDAILARALEVEPEDRYQSAGEFTEDLLAFRAHEPVTARVTAGRVYRMRKFVRRNRLAVGVASMFALLLVLGTAVSLWQAVRATGFARDASYQLAASQSQTMLDTQPVEALALAAKTAREQLEDQGKVSPSVAYSLANAAHYGRLFGELNVRETVVESMVVLEELAMIAVLGAGKLSLVSLVGESLRTVPLVGDWELLEKGEEPGELFLTTIQGDIVRLRINEDGDADVRARWSSEGSGLVGLAALPEGTVGAVDTEGRLTIWKGDGKLLREISLGEGTVNRAIFSPDGRQVAVARGELMGHGGIDLFAVDDGRQLGSCLPPEGWLGAMAFTPGGGLLTGGTDSMVRQWTLQGAPARPSLGGHTGEVGVVAASEDGRLWASGDTAGLIRLMRSPADDKGIFLPAHVYRVQSLVFIDGGRTLVSHGRSGKIRLWDTRGLELRAPLDVGSATRGLLFSDAGTRMATSSDDGMFRIFSYPNLELLHEVRAHAGTTRLLMASPDGQRIAAGSSSSGEIVVYNWKGQELARHETGLPNILNGTFLDGSSDFLVGGEGGIVGIGPRAAELKFPSRRISPADVIRDLGDGRFCLFHGGKEGFVGQLGANDLRPLQADLHNMGHFIETYAGGDVLVSGLSEGGSVLRRFDAATDRVVREGEVPLGAEIWCSAVHQASGRAAFADFTGHLSLVDNAFSPIFPRVSAYPLGLAYQIAFHPGGEVLAASGDGGEIRFWIVGVDSMLQLARGRADGWPLPPDHSLEAVAGRGEGLVQGGEVAHPLGIFEENIPEGWDQVGGVALGTIRTAQKAKIVRDASRMEIGGALRHVSDDQRLRRRGFRNGQRSFDLFDTPLVVVAKLPELQGEVAFTGRFAGMIRRISQLAQSSFATMVSGHRFTGGGWDEEGQMLVMEGYIDLVKGGRRDWNLIWIPGEGVATLYLVFGGLGDSGSRIEEIRQVLARASTARDRSAGEIARSRSLIRTAFAAAMGEQMERIIWQTSESMKKKLKEDSVADLDALTAEVRALIAESDELGLQGSAVEQWRIGLARTTLLHLFKHERFEEAKLGLEREIGHYFDPKSSGIMDELADSQLRQLLHLTREYHIHLRVLDEDPESRLRWAENGLAPYEVMARRGVLDKVSEQARFNAGCWVGHALAALGRNDVAIEQYDHALAQLQAAGREPQNVPHPYRLYFAEKMKILRTLQRGEELEGHGRKWLIYAIDAFEGRAPTPEGRAEWGDWGEKNLAAALKAYQRGAEQFPEVSFDMAFFDEAKADFEAMVGRPPGK